MFMKFLFALIVVAFSWPFIGGIVMLAINTVVGLGSLALVVGACWVFYSLVIAPLLPGQGMGDNSEKPNE